MFADPPVHELLDLRQRQAGDVHTVDDGQGPQVGDHLRQRMVGLDVGASIGAHDQDRRGLAVARCGPKDVPQQEEDGLRRPVQVVEHEHERLLAGELDEPRARGLQEQVLLGPSVRDHRQADTRHPRSEERLQASQLRRVAAQHRLVGMPGVPVQPSTNGWYGSATSSSHRP